VTSTAPSISSAFSRTSSTDLANLFDGLDDTNATLSVLIALEPAGPAAARVDLAFYDPDRATEILGCVLGFLDRIGDGATRNRDPEFAEQRLGLIFVNIHDCSAC
jgi:hypothetical protein